MRLALLQANPISRDTDRALQRLRQAAGSAAAAGAGLLITPEMFLSGYDIGAEAVAALAEPRDGALFHAVSAIAREHRIAILYGYPERDGAAIYNAVRLITAGGDVVADYRKTHLYGDVDRRQFSAGDRLGAPVDLAGWRVALSICYDIEFPEVARAQAAAGAELLLCPTANMIPYDSIATRLVPARAEENTVFAAYANYCGAEGSFRYCGLSCVIGPDGEDLARAGRGEELLVADLDRARLSRVRADAAHLRDRRPELYAGVTSPAGEPHER
ncbi:MAG: carbon-nitrogen hydrolase family protein [Alphaproteobacteria bacterium]|nr:carbon-nitrogen hydrolase family protein [Alphaproteobacteria bacterium]